MAPKAKRSVVKRPASSTSTVLVVKRPASSTSKVLAQSAQRKAKRCVAKRPASSTSKVLAHFAQGKHYWYFVEKILYAHWILESDRTWTGVDVFTDKHDALICKCFVPHMGNRKCSVDEDGQHWLCRVRKEKRFKDSWEFEDTPGPGSVIITDYRYERGRIRLDGCICGHFMCSCDIRFLNKRTSSQCYGVDL